MENIKELTLNSQEPAPHEAPDFALLKARVTSEDIENLRTSLTPRRQKHFNSIDPDVQAEYAVLFKFPEEELKRLIPFLSSEGDYTFSMNTISDALDFLDQGIAGGNGKYQSLKKFVKKWREGNIHSPVLKQEEEYKEEGQITPDQLILDFMIAEGEVTEKDVAAFKEKLLFDGKKRFDKYSPEDQIMLTAADKMPPEKWRQALRMAIMVKEKKMAKLHNVIGNLNFLMVQTKPGIREKYEELEVFTKKAWAKNKKSEIEARAKE